MDGRFVPGGKRMDRRQAGVANKDQIQQKQTGDSTGDSSAGSSESLGRWWGTGAVPEHPIYTFPPLRGRPFLLHLSIHLTPTQLNPHLPYSFPSEPLLLLSWNRSPIQLRSLWSQLPTTSRLSELEWAVEKMAQNIFNYINIFSGKKACLKAPNQCLITWLLPATYILRWGVCVITQGVFTSLTHLETRWRAELVCCLLSMKSETFITIREDSWHVFAPCVIFRVRIAI